MLAIETVGKSFILSIKSVLWVEFVLPALSVAFIVNIKDSPLKKSHVCEGSGIVNV